MATRFQGEHTCKLDAKGRIMFPARMKNALPETDRMKVVLKKGFEPCLMLYPYAEWESLINRFGTLDEFNPKARKFERSFLRGVEEVEMDNNYRLLIPKKFINELKFNKEVIVLGVNNRVEIWDPELLDNHTAEDEEYSDLASEMMTGGEKN